VTPTRVAWTLFAASAAVRVVYVWLVSDHPLVTNPIGDSLAYHRAALQILGGDWIGSEVFYQDPLYPYLLAGLYGVFGVGSTGVLVVQALIDSMSVVLVYWTARELFDDRTAWVAGALACLYRVSWFYDALLLKVPLTLLLAASTAWLLMRADSRQSLRAWFISGVALGLATLTRGNYLVFVPILVGWLGFATAGALTFRLRAMAAVFLGLALTIGPVALRNTWVADDFVLITSQAGQNFYIGNNRDNASGVYKAPKFVIANAEHEQSDFRSEAKRRTGGPMKPSELSSYWFSEAFREIAADPAHFARHTWRKFRLFFNHYEVPDNQSFVYFAQHVTGLLKLPTPSYGVLLPLAAAGLWFARRKRSAWLLALFFASYAASVIGFFNVSRYRIPALPAVFVFAGYAATVLWAMGRRRETGDLRSLGVALLCIAAGIAFTHQKLIDEDFALVHSNLGTALSRRATEHEELGRAAADRGEAMLAANERLRANALWQEAEQQLRRGFEIRNRDPQFRNWLKTFLFDRIETLRQREDWTAALAVSETLTSTFPRDAQGFTISGELYEARGDLERADRAFVRALSVSPGDRRARRGRLRVRDARRTGS
jgi:4-amino-4-deoxy-L-arabinose transferase-like glycosyltransferase